MIRVILTTALQNAIRETQFHPWMGKIPWRKAWQPTPVFLPGEAHGQGAWWATVDGVAKSGTQLSN